jgi:GntR family transcriptional regulator/MocR family aminotransferase
MRVSLPIALDRSARIALSAQIHGAIRDAIHDGRLAGGARLPSWRDLAAQLGVARGTVRAAYERLNDEQLLVTLGAAGSRVAARVPAAPTVDAAIEAPPLPELFHDFESPPLPFQMGAPAQDAFPFVLWSRIMARSARLAAAAPVSYPDPRGHPELRREIAAYLAIARGVRCAPQQVLVTAGFSGALGLALHALRLDGGSAWLENPGFPLTRKAIEFAGLKVEAVPVDEEGIDVVEGMRRAPRAALAVVTPGQQAPLGMTMSLARRQALLEWARRSDAWIIEDDYLGELQLAGRAAPALASLDPAGRVLLAGTFSKTISPALRLGFLVVPAQLVPTFATVAACLAPAPSPAAQRAVAAFMVEGHYLRHLRRMKRLYAARRNALATCLREMAHHGVIIQGSGALSVRLGLPDGASDVEMAARTPGRRARPVCCLASPICPRRAFDRIAPGCWRSSTNPADQSEPRQRRAQVARGPHGSATAAAPGNLPCSIKRTQAWRSDRRIPFSQGNRIDPHKIPCYPKSSR